MMVLPARVNLGLMEMDDNATMSMNAPTPANECVGQAQCENTFGGYDCTCPDGLIAFEGLHCG